MSFSKAAEELLVTPAAISHQIHSQEGVQGCESLRRRKCPVFSVPGEIRANPALPARRASPRLRDSVRRRAVLSSGMVGIDPGDVAVAH